MVKRISSRKLIRALFMYFPGLISVYFQMKVIRNRQKWQTNFDLSFFMDRTKVGCECDIADYESFFHRNLMLIHFSIVVQDVIVHEKLGILVLLFLTMKCSDQKSSFCFKTSLLN